MEKGADAYSLLFMYKILFLVKIPYSFYSIFMGSCVKINGTVQLIKIVWRN